MNSQRGQPSASTAAHTQPLLQPPHPNRHGSRAASGNSSNDVDHDDDQPGIFRSLRRRSSVVHGIADIGGVNSLHNFARSWTRAAGFWEVEPIHKSFVLPDDDDEGPLGERRSDIEAPKPYSSLLRAALANNDQRKVSVASPVFEEDEFIAPEDTSNGTASETVRHRPSNPHIRGDSIFQIEPSLASPFGGMYGGTYGSLASRVNESSIRHAGELFMRQQAAGVSEPDKEREPLLVKQVQTDEGKTVNVVVGQSTIYQTIFNSVNVLIGVGMLALPLAIAYSGWIIGLGFFAAAAITTQYTAKLLAKCLDVDGSLITFSDLAYVSFGPSARVAVSLLFSVELFATCVALVILFADSLNALIDGWGVNEFKVVCGVIIIPLGFLPLRLLSITSILGIVSSVAIVIAIFADGLVKAEGPGSLRDPRPTSLFPTNWKAVPLALGLLMAPWGGHSVFPNIYRDMRHPHKYPKAVRYTYVNTFALETAIGVAGYLMFGDDVKDELTASIFTTEGYPRVLSIIMVIAVAIIPLTKIPLNTRPIISTLEIFCGLDARALPESEAMTGMSGLSRGILKLTIRIGLPVSIIIVAIFVPSFDKIMALLGSLAGFMICIILPCLFHLTLFKGQLSTKQQALDWTLVVVASIISLTGTIFAFLPKSLLGIRE